MYASRFLMPTLRETPAEAEVVSHQLLLKAGFIRKSASGIYSLLPLAQRSLQKLIRIICEEMDQKGGQQVLLPILQPAELWLESGRWDVYGPELFRLQDRHGRDFCLGPTHEEIVTQLMRADVRSYKQLPVLVYQIQNKYRDERRPRFGLLRGREFIMKDLYSFDQDEEGLEKSYQNMYSAYEAVFNRCGLSFRAVEADSGAIGGSTTEEFMVLANSGEALVLFCGKTDCNYAANEEKATSKMPAKRKTEDQKPLALKATPEMHTAEEVAAYLEVGTDRLIKTLLYETDQGVYAALVRGDREINEIKLKNALEVTHLKLAGAEQVETLTKAALGFAGPVELPGVKLLVDEEVATLVNAVAGANKTDTHFVNVNPGRDFPLDWVTDLKQVVEGDPCPRCGTSLDSMRGIEVGQVFKLGTKYSEAMSFNYLDAQGQEKPVLMGCYGIGVTRTLAATVEQNHDENGIIWPIALAPFTVAVIPVNIRDQQQAEVASQLYRDLSEAGVEVIFDDREERAGVKFKDADLIGYPYRITVGKKAAEGLVELRDRKTGETQMVVIPRLTKKVLEILGS